MLVPRRRRRPAFHSHVRDLLVLVIGLTRWYIRTATPEDIAAQQPDGEASDPPITPALSTFYLERPCTVPELTGPDMLIEAITDGCEMFSPEAVELFALDLPDWQDPGP